MRFVGVGAMNWRRGLVRLWVVASLAWAAWALVQILLNPPRSSVPGGDQAFQTEDLVWSIMMIAVPPLAVLICGFLIMGAARYIIRGFRSA
jgi:hypothetical protein